MSAYNLKCEAQALGFILEGDGGSGYFSDLSKLPIQHACLILPDYKDLILPSRDHMSCPGGLTPLERVRWADWRCSAMGLCDSGRRSVSDKSVRSSSSPLLFYHPHRPCHVAVCNEKCAPEKGPNCKMLFQWRDGKKAISSPTLTF